MIENEGVVPSIVVVKPSLNKPGRSLGIRYYDRIPGVLNSLSATHAASSAALSIAQKYANENSRRWNRFATYNWRFTCNEFVADVLTEAGLNIPLTIRTNKLGIEVARPPLAGEWGNPEFEIAGWEIVNSPQPGDVVAVPAIGEGYSGHVGIVSSVYFDADGNLYGTSISQSSETQTVRETKWPFDLPNSRPVFRRPVSKLDS